MQLYFITRDDYRDNKVPDEVITSEDYVINEGGWGKKGAQGAADILKYYREPFTHCCCAVGTGTMMAGLITALADQQKIVGISTLKNNRELEKNVGDLVTGGSKDWQIIHDYHFGGYAKYKPELITFMNEFYGKTNIPSDFVYTGKLFFGIDDL
jgi:1-aminocyclopropane-1-carboxylate deaminase